MTESLSVDVPYGKTASFFERFFGLGLSSRVLSEMIEVDACDVETFYEQKPAPSLAEEGVFLVLQADGKGVPLVRNAEGQLQKKEVIVTGLYTTRIRMRSADQVVVSLYGKEVKIDTYTKKPSISQEPSASRANALCKTRVSHTKKDPLSTPRASSTRSSTMSDSMSPHLETKGYLVAFPKPSFIKDLSLTGSINCPIVG